MHILDLLTVAWLVAGTLAIKSMLGAVRRNRISRGALILCGLVLAAVPLAIVKLGGFTYSWVSVVAAGCCLVWFSILLARVDNAA